MVPDTWLAARTVLARKLKGRPSTSRLPALVDYMLARPIVSHLSNPFPERPGWR
jgi:hypothetical protein